METTFCPCRDPIPRRSEPPSDGDSVAWQRPFVLPGAANRWGARARWRDTPETLRRLLPEPLHLQRVPSPRESVCDGRTPFYASMRPGQRRSRLVKDGDEAAELLGLTRGNRSRGEYIVAQIEGAQWGDDVEQRDIVSWSGESQPGQGLLWASPRQGGESGLHFDGADNLLVLLQGAKRATLFAPEESPRLYPFPDHLTKSQIDVGCDRETTLRRFPLPEDSRRLAEACRSAEDAADQARASAAERYL